ncbi:MAG: hypothetical protein ACRD0G_06175 [Acidimicrobiales bacterium]
MILEEAATDARRLGDGELLASVAWAMTSFGPTVVGAFEETIVSIAEDALRQLAPEPTAARARLLAVPAAEYGGSVVHADRRHDLVQEALTVARQIDNPVTLGHVLVVYQWAAWEAVNVETRLAVADELIAVGERLGLPVFAGLRHGGRTTLPTPPRDTTTRSSSNSVAPCSPTDRRLSSRSRCASATTACAAWLQGRTPRLRGCRAALPVARADRARHHDEHG